MVLRMKDQHKTQCNFDQWLARDVILNYWTMGTLFSSFALKRAKMMSKHLHILITKFTGTKNELF